MNQSCNSKMGEGSVPFKIKAVRLFHVLDEVSTNEKFHKSHLLLPCIVVL